MKSKKHLNSVVEQTSPSFRIEWGKSYIINKGKENELIAVSGAYTTSEQFSNEISTAFEIEVETIEPLK
jgi:hypothetical protein